jgi:hypothetical protein
MNANVIFGLQIFLSLVTFGTIARWHLLPRLSPLPLPVALMPLLLFHTFRTLGLIFLVPGVVGDTLPAAFAVPAAVGDAAAVVLAFGALGALRWRWRGALALVWLFNLEGTADFLYGYAEGCAPVSRPTIVSGPPGSSRPTTCPPPWSSTSSSSPCSYAVAGNGRRRPASEYLIA